MEEDCEAQHYEALVVAWGTAVPIARTQEIESKTPEDLRAWATNCRRRATYALGRGNGDGFFEARMRWYGERAAYLDKEADNKGFAAPKEVWMPPKKRPIDAIRPMNPYPKMRRLADSATTPTVGGWPSAVTPSQDGPTPSGLPTGEKEATSSAPENPSPPLSNSHDALALIRENY